VRPGDAADAVLAEKAKKGDERAFEQLWKKIKPAVEGRINRLMRFARARGLTVERGDLSQEAMLGAWLGLKTFDPERGAAALHLGVAARQAAWLAVNKEAKRAAGLELGYDEAEGEQLNVDGLEAPTHRSKGALPLDEEQAWADAMAAVLDRLPAHLARVLQAHVAYDVGMGKGWNSGHLAEVLGMTTAELKAARVELVELVRAMADSDESLPLIERLLQEKEVLRRAA
jgi:DNA-directed RNA polymerase specialized sigma24 family protein